MSSGHGHHKKSGSDWLAEHMAGFVLPFGKWFEKKVEKNAHVIHGMYAQLGMLYLFIAAPIIVIFLGLYFIHQLFG